MNLANKLSILRILLVPFFIASLVYYSPQQEVLRFVALSIFTVAVLTDAVDGYIARIKNIKTKLGTFLDPIADKLLLISAFICLSVIGNMPKELRLPAWVPIIVVSRDAIIIFGSLLIYIVAGSLKVMPSLLGKLTTFFQMLTIIAMLLQFKFSFILWNIAIIFTVLSGIGYIIRGSKLFNGAQGSYQ
ncbi:MAG: CDP-diacylglycerol--glycerol-3-phosphate 3-phosphatidyltransferase [Candidatus Omnitrophica bacterium]|nr:CDP-diacylglycerol--glycerol-3-phosphate 3-phosphatidyltransferase [Candidatus Omnitrophota bacterium]